MGWCQPPQSYNVLLGRDEGLEVLWCWRGQSHPLQQLPFFDKTSDVAISDLSFLDLTSTRRQDAECTGGTVASAKYNSETEDDTLLSCPEDGRVKSFQMFLSLQKHLDGGSHRYALERESLRDKAMLRYAESGAASIEENVQAVISEEFEEVSFVKLGWALKHAHQTTIK